MKQHTKDLLELHFLVLLWGFTAVLGLLIEIPPVEIVFYRTFISFVVIGIGLLIAGRELKIQLGELPKLFAVGFMFASHWILFFLAAKVSNASLCLAGMATTALWSSLLEPIFSKKRISKLEIVVSLVAIVGISIVLSVEFDRALGLILAIGAALIASLFTIANKRIVTKHEPFKIMFYEMMGAAIGIALFLPFYKNYLTGGELRLVPSSSDWVFLFVLAVICTVYAYTMSVKLLKRISAFTVNFTVNLEPVYGIVLAVIILGENERMGMGFYLGTLLILLSVISYPALKRRLHKGSI